MKEVIHSDEFDKWLHKLRDSRAKFRIYKRTQQADIVKAKKIAKRYEEE